MRIGRIRITLWASALAMTALAAWSIVMATGSASLPQAQSGVANDARDSSATLGETRVTAHDLDQVATINLRRVLHDPPPPAPTPPPPPKPIPPLNIKVTGTIFEPGHCRAMIQFPDGGIQLKAIGESAGEARITDIQEGTVTIEYYGKAQVLTVAKTGGI